MARMALVVMAIGTVLWATVGWSAEVGLVTAVSGGVKLQGEKAITELKPFVKLRDGDRLMLESASRVQIVFFEGGRQESWQGAGALEIGVVSGRAVKGGLQPEIKTLPAILVKQLSKTPSPNGNVKAGMVRMRTLADNDPLALAEKTYADLRRQAEASDRNPELYLLSSYLELKKFDRIEALLRQMAEKSPGDSEIKVLTSLYNRAINNAKMAAQ